MLRILEIIIQPNWFLLSLSQDVVSGQHHGVSHSSPHQVECHSELVVRKQPPRAIPVWLEKNRTQDSSCHWVDCAICNKDSNRKFKSIRDSVCENCDKHVL